MSTSLAVSLRIVAQADLTPSSPITGAILARLENATGGRYWTQGTSTGNASQCYIADVTLSSGQTVNYNTLAAGALVDTGGATVDLDELKGLIVLCNTGAIKIDAPAANFIGIFADATDKIRIGAGQCVAFDFGPGGLDVTTNSKWDIVETASAAATYSIMFWGAQ
jgi:hypothetical protein